MRSWSENKSVIELAAVWQRPLISGGDRHGCEPSGALNLTQATSFPEFINEIRRDHLSHIVFMPQYAEAAWHPFRANRDRHVRDYPEHPVVPAAGTSECSTWIFRPVSPSFYPLSGKAPPPFLGHIFSIFRMVENASVRPRPEFYV